MTDLLTEVHLISDTYNRVREERTFAIDDIEYDLFAAGWKQCAKLAADRVEALEADNQRYRAALMEISDESRCATTYQIAKQALEKK
jgi:hypothetical protein